MKTKKEIVMTKNTRKVLKWAAGLDCLNPKCCQNPKPKVAVAGILFDGVKCANCGAVRGDQNYHWKDCDKCATCIARKELNIELAGELCDDRICCGKRYPVKTETSNGTVLVCQSCGQPNQKFMNKKDCGKCPQCLARKALAGG